MTVPLQIIDNFLLNYNIGHVLLLSFGLAVVTDVVVLRSQRILALHLLVFGLLFLATPASLLGVMSLPLRVVGVVLMLAGPLAYTLSGR